LQRQKYNTSVIELPSLLLSSFLHDENKWLYEFVYVSLQRFASVHACLYILAIFLFCNFVIYLFFFLSPRDLQRFGLSTSRLATESTPLDVIIIITICTHLAAAVGPNGDCIVFSSVVAAVVIAR